MHFSTKHLQSCCIVYNVWILIRISTVRLTDRNWCKKCVSANSLGGVIMFIFLCVFCTQIDTGERRTSLSLQGLGAKPGGCGAFQVSCHFHHHHILNNVFLLLSMTSSARMLLSCQCCPEVKRFSANQGNSNSISLTN